MKKVFLLVPMVIAMVSCSKKHEQVEPSKQKNQEVIYGELREPVMILEERKYRIQRDTFYDVDKEVGFLYMVIEETKIYE